MSVRLISSLSLKAIILILATLMLFALLIAPLAMAEEGEETIDTSGLEAQAERSIFDMFLGGKKASDDEQADLNIDEESITVQDNGAGLVPAAVATIRVIDKTLGKLYTIDVEVGARKNLNELTLKVSSCLAVREPQITPVARAQVEIYENHNRVYERIYNGWMLSHSPSVSQLTHPKYDVSLADCKFKSSASGAKNDVQTDAGSAPTEVKIEDKSDKNKKTTDLQVTPTLSPAAAPKEQAASEDEHEDTLGTNVEASKEPEKE